MQAQEAVFIRGDKLYTMALTRGDSTAIKQAVYAKQRQLVVSTRDDDWSVQPVTNNTVRLMRTYPGGWSMEGKEKDDRPLLYFHHQRPNGDKGVVAILMAVELKDNEPLYTNPEEPYIFQQYFMDSEKRVGINIRKGVPKKTGEGKAEGGDAVMEEAAAGAALEAAGATGAAVGGAGGSIKERVFAVLLEARKANPANGWLSAAHVARILPECANHNRRWFSALRNERRLEHDPAKRVWRAIM